MHGTGAAAEDAWNVQLADVDMEPPATAVKPGAIRAALDSDIN